MGTNNAHTDTVTDLTAARDAALATVKELAAEVKSLDDSSPLMPLAEADLCETMEIHADAENALRLAVDGYEETYSHPMGGVHPGDAYSGTLCSR